MKILLIEDSKHLQASLSKAFKKCGFACDFAFDGEEGLWFAENNEYDVIVLDLMLPKIDGLTILKTLRAKGKETPVLILSARDTLGDKVGGLGIGADDYLTKPFELDELIARISALIRRKYKNKNPIIKIGENIEINTSKKSVNINSNEVTLTPREYNILEYLAQRKGQLVSRTEIENHIYDYEKDLMSNVVDSTICNLRKKLTGSTQSNIIQTKRGLGYIIND